MKIIQKRFLKKRIIHKRTRKCRNLSLLTQEQLAGTPLMLVAVLEQLIRPHNLRIAQGHQFKRVNQNHLHEPSSAGEQSSSNHRSVANIQISSASATTWARSVERRSTRSLETIPLSGWAMSEATGMRTVGTNTATSCMMLRRLRPFPRMLYFSGIDGPHPIFTISE